MLGIQQETRQTCLLSLWNSRGKADIKQIIICMKSVFKKAECGDRQGITHLEIASLMFKMKS